MLLRKISSTPTLLRRCVQWGFLLWCLYLGSQFALFVRHFETGGAAPRYVRPPGVEAFLPIGSLVSLKNWLVNGLFDPVHPAALVLFLTFSLLCLLARKSFCSWLCPLGTFSELLWRLGRRLRPEELRVPKLLDTLLMLPKYLLLFFFAKVILWDMPPMAARLFLESPYWAVSDVKMLHFFTGISGTALFVVAVLCLLSVFLKNFWCRYLCPYGAWLGLFSLLSPAHIRRDEAVCTGCGACSRACPSRIAVAQKKRVLSAECTGCLGCVQRCPEPGALAMRWATLRFSGFHFALTVLAVFAIGVGAGMLSGHWQSSLGYGDFQRLILLAPRLSH